MADTEIPDCPRCRDLNPIFLFLDRNQSGFILFQLAAMIFEIPQNPTIGYAFAIEGRLLVSFSAMVQPTPFMTFARVMVGPMDNTAFRIPFIYTVEINMIAYSKISDSWCNIDIMRN